MQTVQEKLKALKAYVAKTPGASLRLEELLFRFGDPTDEHGNRLEGDPVLKGAHVTYLLREPGPTGERISEHGPFPIEVAKGDPLLDSLLSDVHVTQQATIDKERAERKAERQAMFSQHQAEREQTRIKHEAELITREKTHREHLKKLDKENVRLSGLARQYRDKSKEPAGSSATPTAGETSSEASRKPV